MAADTFTLQIDLIDGTQQVLTLRDQPVVVGSSRSSDVRLKADYVSRRHFQVEVVGGRVYVTDLGSQNGTYLNGQRLEPGRRQAWLPGDMLAIANTVRATILGRMTAPPPQPAGQIQLAVEPKTLRPNQPALLALTYSGGQTEQQVYFRAYSFVEGVEFELQPREHFVPPGGTVNVRARAFPVKMFLMGGVVPVSFSAMTGDGLFAKADAVLRLRPRLELLLLALLLLCPATVVGAAAIQQVISIALAPTATPTFTPEPTALPTLTPTLLPSETPTPAPTATATLTPFPTATSCFNQCAALGWPSYLVREGDTLSSLAAAGGVSVARAAQVNCLVDPSRIQVGQRICLPVIPTTPAPTCDGFRLTSPSALPNGVATFYWDPPRGFAPTGYRVRVFNAENGSQLVSRDVPGTATNTQIDVSQGAIGGNFTFFWTVETLVNGTAVCSSRVDGLREAPTPIPRSDLVVTSLTTTGGVWDATCSNFSIPLNYSVRNVGDRGSGNFFSRLSYQIGTLGGSQCEPNSGRPCPGANLAPGASASFSHTEVLPATLLSTVPNIQVVATADTSGNTALGQVCADAGFCNSPERDEGNNRSAVLNVPVPACTPPPDLVVLNYDTGVSWSSDNCPDSLNITVYFNIRNQGGQTAGASTTQVTVRVYYNDQTITRTYTGTASTPAIAVGGTSTGSVTISAPTFIFVGGEFYVSIDSGAENPFTITADSGGVVAESNEGNNGLAASIIVPDYPVCLS